MAGILWQWYAPFPEGGLILALLIAATLFFLCFFLSYSTRFRYPFIPGILIALIFLCIGSLLCFHKDIRNNKNWFGNNLKEGQTCLAVIEENPAKKKNSYKAVASIYKGKIIIYSDTLPAYGSRVVFRKSLQQIKNSTNTGTFDFRRYALFKGITHSVYLKRSDYVVLDEKKEDPFKIQLQRSRNKVLKILRENIPGKRESGLAEALLIGYKAELDPELVRSYTNTGVVHIIAISGMHLGLIYWLLLLLVKPIKEKRWLSILLILTGLWAFSLLAGAQASVMRSAFMFSILAIGENCGRKNSIYNSLAASAFIMLCINPFSLWDPGFQLSYAAVLSIVLFMRPIYNCIYIKNKFLDLVWKLNAVTLAAQVLTLPISIYYFHQFPALFLFSNLLAVPLSSAIVLGEIFLCSISFFPFLAEYAGKFISALIRFMNNYIEMIGKVPFANWNGIYISLAQTILLYIFISILASILMNRLKSRV